MNYTETFEQFASKTTTTDLALYAGIGIILWVLFKDKLSPVQKLASSVIEKLKSSKSLLPPAPIVTPKPVQSNEQSEDVFFQLIVSWKQTRDLASKCGCAEAVKVADQMFPFLSPVGCGKAKYDLL